MKDRNSPNDSTYIQVLNNPTQVRSPSIRVEHRNFSLLILLGSCEDGRLLILEIISSLVRGFFGNLYE